MDRLGGSEGIIYFDVVLLRLRFCFPLWFVGANRRLSAHTRFVPAGLAGADCPGLATLCAFFLSFLWLRTLVDDEMPCCDGGLWCVASLVDLL